MRPGDLGYFGLDLLLVDLHIHPIAIHQPTSMMGTPLQVCRRRGGREGSGGRVQGWNRGRHEKRERGEERGEKGGEKRGAKGKDIPHHRLQSRTHPIDLKSFR